MDLSNKDQAEKLLKAVAPELLEMREAMERAEIKPEVMLEFISEVAKSKQTRNKQHVTLHIDKGKEQGVTAGIESEEKKDNYLYDAMANAGVHPTDIVRGLYLLANIRRFSKWGKVIYLMQDGQVVRVAQEQGYKLD